MSLQVKVTQANPKLLIKGTLFKGLRHAGGNSLYLLSIDDNEDSAWHKAWVTVSHKNTAKEIIEILQAALPYLEDDKEPNDASS